MTLSANSIIHYTSKFDTIKKILQDSAFKVSYCKEKINTLGGQSISFALAMVSFCDIPLSAYNVNFAGKGDNYLGYYGDYGIGLSKKWAINKKINPVLYIDYHSNVGTGLRKLYDYFRSGNDVNLNSFQLDEISQIAFYSKNYQGENNKNGKSKKDYRFYDEREWRFVPIKNNNNDSNIVLNLDIYEKKKKEFQESIANIKLPFDLNDISYIIVKNNDEVVDLIDFIKQKYQNGALQRTVDILISKIITIEQIKHDF